MGNENSNKIKCAKFGIKLHPSVFIFLKYLTSRPSKGNIVMRIESMQRPSVMRDGHKLFWISLKI